MCFVIPLFLAIGMVGAAPAPRALPRGGEHFRLGMSRAQLDRVVAARNVTVISSGATFLACESDDPRVEYEQYSFYQAPHGMVFLWKVTVGYRLSASPEDFAAVRTELMERLGEPLTDASDANDSASRYGERPAPTSAQAVWADPATAVRLGARWTGAADRAAERMLVTWIDRRLQRLAEARPKKAKQEDSEAK